MGSSFCIKVGVQKFFFYVEGANKGYVYSDSFLWNKDLIRIVGVKLVNGHYEFGHGLDKFT